ncbi:MAG: hypothetical protein FWF06_04890 [Symbiobacteriaceae bacterium]|nr:hypothetical protein [Symbiobacteriaceae bacterium]
MKEIFTRLLDGVPDYKEFMTVREMDESSRKLAQQYPETVELMEIGRSRSNYPLLCLKIGSGEENALMLGCPHPNEPIGTMLLEYFCEELAKSEELRQELGYTWYIVKSWDCDGTMLNENWFKGPFTITNYARNFFRPAGHQQVDWTFPITYKDYTFNSPIPETVAVMKLIEETKPRFLYSLHNAGFGGVYWYVSRPTPGIYDAMHKAAKGQEVPLNLGEPETPYSVAFYPAVYKKNAIKDRYDYLEENGTENIPDLIETGTCGADYAETVNPRCFTLLTELPYFFDPRISDMSPSDMIRKDAVLDKIAYDEESNSRLFAVVERTNAYVSDDNPFKSTLISFTKPRRNEATIKMVQTNPDYARLASVSEKFSNLLIAKFYKLLSFGMLIRAFEYELASLTQEEQKNAEEKTRALSSAKDEALSMFAELASYLEEHIHYENVPIKKLVTIQLESGILTALYLREHPNV